MTLQNGNKLERITGKKKEIGESDTRESVCTTKKGLRRGRDTVRDTPMNPFSFCSRYLPPETELVDYIDVFGA